MSYLFNINEFDNDFCESSLKTIKDYQNKLALNDILKSIKINNCPHCDSNNFIKYGKYKGIQRFRCMNKECKKTFSSKTNTLFYNSKKSTDIWIKYFILMNNGKSLRECSSILNINLATAFFWRHKILITQINNNNKILKSYVEISKIMIKENFKGNKLAKYHKKETIFIACGMDSNNTIISKPISRYTISLVSINKNFTKNIDNDSIISSYNDRYFDIFAKKHNSSSLPLCKNKIVDLIQQITENKIISNPTNELITINEHLPYKSIFIHKFSLKIKIWLKRFRGVSTKYLENYLNWHIIDFKNNYKTFLIDQIKLLKENFISTIYIKIKDFPNYKVVY